MSTNRHRLILHFINPSRRCPIFNIQRSALSSTRSSLLHFSPSFVSVPLPHTHPGHRFPVPQFHENRPPSFALLRFNFHVNPCLCSETLLPRSSSLFSLFTTKLERLFWASRTTFSCCPKLCFFLPMYPSLVCRIQFNVLLVFL